ncbi:MAG: HsdR family type I site-specific deoxyribonuclease [Verrucomicrobiota bacterium]
MSEYHHVEKPLLTQLEALGWQVVDHRELGMPGIPDDPSASGRNSFRETILPKVFRDAVRRINTTDDGREWLTDGQLDQLAHEIGNHPGKSLIEANRAVHEMLLKHSVSRNELTGEESPTVRFIDFKHPERNEFIAINQFRVDTPGAVRPCIIPDLVLFVNGLPLVLVECKERNATCANPFHEALEQFLRYSNQREDTHKAGLREGEEKLFHANQLVILTWGEGAKVGTVTSREEHFYQWRDIACEEHKAYTPPLGSERPQEVMVQGVLPKSTLLNIVRNYIVYQATADRVVKMACRYPQYRAVERTIERLRSGAMTGERSGYIWHTQGSGKSITMVFLVRRARSSDDLRDLKVLMVNDRTDLEEQLGQTAALAGEKVYFIDSTKKAKEDLASTASNLNMVMVHKFQEEKESALPSSVQGAIKRYGPAKAVEQGKGVPRTNPFGVVNRSERILILIDEAHRTQLSDLGLNVVEAFPNAATVAFTGTPLLKGDRAERFVRRFGTYIDKYKLEDAVADGATVRILYEGKTADSAIYDKSGFDRKFEDLFRERTPDELLAIKKRYGATGDILEAENRIAEIAGDLVDHYIGNILPNGFKAQAVASSKLAAVRYEKAIEAALAGRIRELEVLEERDEELLSRLRFLKVATVVSADGTNELAEITAARKKARTLNAVANFKKAFDFSKREDGSFERPETGVAFLVVCDMLLTGFDAPIEQVMYLDKKITEHNLLQTIARVNRVRKGKTCGYIVDYIGLANHLREALAIYSEEDQQEIGAGLGSIESEVPVLEARFQRLIHFLKDAGVEPVEDFVKQKIADRTEEAGVLEHAVQVLEDVRRRDTFDVYLKKFMESLEIILPHRSGQAFRFPAQRFGFIMACVRERYKDTSLDIAGAGKKVSKLVNDHLVSLGINPMIPPVELFSPEFTAHVNHARGTKAKASEMEHAIRKHTKVHFEEDPVFYEKMSEKLEGLIQKHKDNWEQLALALDGLRDEVLAGREDGDENGTGLDPLHQVFHDLMRRSAFSGDAPNELEAAQLVELTKGLVERIGQSVRKVNFWQNPTAIGQLQGEIKEALFVSGIPPLIENADEIKTELTALAKKRHGDLTAS